MKQDRRPQPEVTQESDPLPARPESVSPSDHLAALAYLAEQRKQRIERRQRIAPHIESLLQKLDDEVASKMGRERWQKYRVFLAERRRTNHGIQQGSDDAAGQAELARARRESRERAAALLEGSPLKPQELLRIREKYAKKIRDLKDGERPRPNAEVVPEDQVPQRFKQAAGSASRGVVFTKTPPFESYPPDVKVVEDGAGQVFILNNYVDATVGRVGHQSTSMNLDADDNDNLGIDWNSTLGFHLNIPTTGYWDVWIKVFCEKQLFSFWFYNEWGWSYVSSSMSSSLFFAASTFPPVNLANDNPYAIASLGNDPRSGDTLDGSYTYEKNTGKQFWIHYKTPFKVPAKNGTFVVVGTYDDVESTLNDYSALLTMTNKWKIQQVWIEVTPT